jgi:hypothetical protein
MALPGASPKFNSFTGNYEMAGPGARPQFNGLTGQYKWRFRVRGQPLTASRGNMRRRLQEALRNSIVSLDNMNLRALMTEGDRKRFAAHDDVFACYGDIGQAYAKFLVDQKRDTRPFPGL